MRRARPRIASPRVLAVGLACALTACGPEPIGSRLERDLPTCDLDTDLLFSSVAADAIPSLLQPEMVTIGDPGLAYLSDADRVLGVLVDGMPRAYPHNIFWHHEIVSDKVGDRYVTATFCPLTGSGLVFDPSVAGEQLDIGVSGLLFANNLVLYDRTSGDVYGPQLSVEGRCSRFRDLSLELLPVMETSWGRWRVLHPNTAVVTGNTGFERDYRLSPYAGYDALDNDELLFEMAVDDSRPLKERVLAIRESGGGLGFPFGELGQLGVTAVVHTEVGGRPTVVFYDRTDGETAVAFESTLGSQDLTFEPDGSGRWTDLETGSTWAVTGQAVDGPLRCERLTIREDAFVVYWFAWRHFEPDAELWTS